jgi:hypothetical protein
MSFRRSPTGVTTIRSMHWQAPSRFLGSKGMEVDVACGGLFSPRESPCSSLDGCSVALLHAAWTFEVVGGTLGTKRWRGR